MFHSVFVACVWKHSFIVGGWRMRSYLQEEERYYQVEGEKEDIRLLKIYFWFSFSSRLSGLIPRTPKHLRFTKLLPISKRPIRCSNRKERKKKRKTPQAKRNSPSLWFLNREQKNRNMPSTLCLSSLLWNGWCFAAFWVLAISFLHSPSSFAFPNLAYNFLHILLTTLFSLLGLHSFHLYYFTNSSLHCIIHSLSPTSRASSQGHKFVDCRSSHFHSYVVFRHNKNSSHPNCWHHSLHVVGRLCPCHHQSSFDTSDIIHLGLSFILQIDLEIFYRFLESKLFKIRALVILVEVSKPDALWDMSRVTEEICWQIMDNVMANFGTSILTRFHQKSIPSQNLLSS